MESIIVHTKNSMELTALKSVLKEMGIKYEKFHTRNTNTSFKPKKATFESKITRSPKPNKPKGL